MYKGISPDWKNLRKKYSDLFNHRVHKFNIGEGQVIKGWDEGIAKMSKG